MYISKTYLWLFGLLLIIIIGSQFFELDFPKGNRAFSKTDVVVIPTPLSTPSPTPIPTYNPPPTPPPVPSYHTKLCIPDPFFGDIGGMICDY